MKTGSTCHRKLVVDFSAEDTMKAGGTFQSPVTVVILIYSDIIMRPKVEYLLKQTVQTLIRQVLQPV